MFRGNLKPRTDRKSGETPLWVSTRFIESRHCTHKHRKHGIAAPPFGIA
jgi:hypothetical protein